MIDLINVVNTWGIKTIQEKIEILQSIEHLQSTQNQHRQERKIMLTDKNEECKEYASAQYNFTTPNLIFVRKIDNPIEAIISVIHEGIHAMFDDAFNGRISECYIHFKIDKKELCFQRKYKNDIYNHFFQTQHVRLFELCYIEEEITHKEAKCYFLELLRASIKWPIKREYDTRFRSYEEVFIKEISKRRLLRQLENEYHTTYREELKKIDFETSGHIEQIKDFTIRIVSPEISGHFNMQAMVYANIHNDKMLNKKEENISKFTQRYYEFFNSHI